MKMLEMIGGFLVMLFFTMSIEWKRRPADTPSSDLLPSALGYAVAICAVLAVFSFVLEWWIK